MKSALYDVVGDDDDDDDDCGYELLLERIKVARETMAGLQDWEEWGTVRRCVD